MKRSVRVGSDIHESRAPQFASLVIHGGREENILEFNKICQFRVSQLAYFIERLKATADEDGSLLDNTVVLWGSPMGDANLHNHRRCPLVLLGGGNDVFETGVHYKAPDGTPMANVFLTLLHRLGHDDMSSFGDSTGEFLL